MPSLPIPFALQRNLTIHLPVITGALRIGAMPQHADKSSRLNPVFLLHLSAAVKARYHAGFVVLAYGPRIAVHLYGTQPQDMVSLSSSAEPSTAPQRKQKK